MQSLLGDIARKALGHVDAEQAHNLAIKGLSLLPPQTPKADDPRLAMKAFGLTFPNPIGLAAGFDKNAQVPDAMLGFGFGFVEIGTLTPLAQAGNPKPRVFRLPQDRGVINRLGFNNEGHQAGLKRLMDRAGRPGIVGVNIGANKDTEDKAADYVAGIRTFAPVASYFTVNISSPNTPGLRDLQKADALDDLLARVMAARDDVAGTAGHKPVLLKIAPDMTLAELDDVIACARRRAIDGLIVSNTTISRPGSLKDQTTAREIGGLSGRPLFDLSTAALAAAFLRVEGAFPLVGVGGVDSAEAALAKIAAGASLVQLYSGLVYEGPGLVGRIKADMVKYMNQNPELKLNVMVGSRADQLQEKV